MFKKEIELNTVTVSKAEENLSRLVEDAKESGEPTFILKHGRPEAVVLSNEVYEKLVNSLSELEELDFYNRLNERISKGPGKLIPAEKVSGSNINQNPFSSLSDDELFS